MSRKLIIVERCLIIRQTHTLRFSIPTTFWKDLPKEDEDKVCYLQEAFRASKENFLRSVDIMLGRPDLCAHLQDLYLMDDWTPSQFEDIADEFDPRTEADLYNPISDAFALVLMSSRNLMTVTLSGLTFSFDLVRNMCQIPSIHSLRLISCHFRFEDRLPLRESGLSCSAYNLQLTVSSQSIWLILLVQFPNLRTFGVRNQDERDVILPLPVVWSKCTLFHSMQRLSLSSIHNASTPLLPSVLVSQPGGFIHLTHFKLYVRAGVPDTIILDMLHALRIAPLEVLVLEGIAQGNLAIIDHIAEHFPQLLGLTLLRQEDEHQHEGKLAAWPHFSWEFASRFSAFERLQHFGCNFQTNRLERPLNSMIPCEDGLLEPTSIFTKIYNVESDQDNLHFEDNQNCLLLPFASHCKTLRTFVILSRSGSPEAHRISRGSDGAIIIKRSTSLSAWNQWNIDEWNPFHWTLGWPTIIPPSSDEDCHNSRVLQDKFTGV